MSIRQLRRCGSSLTRAPPAPRRALPVINQAVPMTAYNGWTGDAALVQTVRRAARSASNETLSSLEARDNLTNLGAAVGDSEWQHAAATMNTEMPRLETHDRFGHRIDRIEYHPTYHDVMARSIRHGAGGFAGAKDERHVERAAAMYLAYQLESGSCCPITMSFAAGAALATQSAEGEACSESYASTLRRALRTQKYDGRDVPMEEKGGVTVGMSMTEKQGGSDVRANTTRATPIGSADAEGASGHAFALNGHKWFTSAPMSDAFLTLAQTKMSDAAGDERTDAESLSCFIVPRWLPRSGERNVGFSLQRLKTKIGDRSNASAEVEYDNAWGLLLGDRGRGVQTILEMVVRTRLDCVVGSAALMRQCAQLAAAHASTRAAFGAPLVSQPLMRSVLADLALESEAAIATALLLAATFERCERADLGLELAPSLQVGGAIDAADEHAFRRLATAVAKYHVCRRAPAVAFEAMEIHGGNGYIESGPMARLFRQAPLNAIWEGSGNVICLDVLRTLQREPRAAAAFVRIASRHRGVDARYDALLASLDATLERVASSGAESSDVRGARCLVERLAVALQTHALLEVGDERTTRAWFATRLQLDVAGSSGVVALPGAHGFGSLAAAMLPEAEDFLVERLDVLG